MHSPIFSNIDLNKFLKKVFLKKLFLKKLKNKFLLLNKIKQYDYRLLNKKLLNFSNKKLINNFAIMYIIDITFSRSNTFLHVMDSTGKLKFFRSAGYFKFKGKSKKSRFSVFKSIYDVLTKKLNFLKKKPIALHLKNVGLHKFWVIKKLKTEFFIKTIKIFNSFPFNGCRLKKIRRIKNRKIKK